MHLMGHKNLEEEEKNYLYSSEDDNHNFFDADAFTELLQQMNIQARSFGIRWRQEYNGGLSFPHHLFSSS